MDGTGRAWAAGEDAMAALAPEGGLFAKLDPVSFGSSLRAVAWRAALHPYAASAAYWQFAVTLARIGPEAVVRWTGRGPEDERTRRRTAGKRQEVRGPDLAGQPGILRDRAGVLRRGRADRGPAGHWPRRPGDRCEGAAGVRPDARGAGPDQLPGHQPGGAQAGVRDGRCQRGGRRQELPRRPQEQQGHAPAGGHPAVRDRPEPGCHPGAGRVP